MLLENVGEVSKTAKLVRCIHERCGVYMRGELQCLPTLKVLSYWRDCLKILSQFDTLYQIPATKQYYGSMRCEGTHPLSATLKLMKLQHYYGQTASSL